ncbi:ATP-binding cassette domain-containing protein [Anthropogastromicrobium sp.]|uniref:ATP-binding cassette domain-containing protein n=1 Tax=Anthropogastromicrobium sp. TaxID=2981649 RepID=UPI0030792EE3
MGCSDEEVWSAIEKVGLTELVSSLPDGINTELAEGGGNISGGQKKRIAVARALIRDCDTLLIDEMTSSLDIETTDEMVKLILSLSCTVIMITHDIFDSYMDGFSAIY